MAASKRTKASGLLFFLPALAALSATSEFNSDGYDDPAIGTHFEDIGAISGAGADSDASQETPAEAGTSGDVGG